jgi:hypothetical protein
MANDNQGNKHEPGTVNELATGENINIELNEEELKGVSGGLAPIHLTNGTISLAERITLTNATISE